MKALRVALLGLAILVPTFAVAAPQGQTSTTTGTESGSQKTTKSKKHKEKKESKKHSKGSQQQ
jgi:hypothetical protein